MATVYHTLKNCVRGWSTFYTNPLDVSKIISVTYTERLFCLFNPEYIYSVIINYSRPRSDPTFTFRGVYNILLTFQYN